MSGAALPKSSPIFPHKATSPARFLTDAERPARVESRRRAAGQAGGAWTHAGDAAARVVSQAAVTAPDRRRGGGRHG